MVSFCGENPNAKQGFICVCPSSVTEQKNCVFFLKVFVQVLCKNGLTANFNQIQGLIEVKTRIWMSTGGTGEISGKTVAGPLQREGS